MRDGLARHYSAKEPWPRMLACPGSQVNLHGNQHGTRTSVAPVRAMALTACVLFVAFNCQGLDRNCSAIADSLRRCFSQTVGRSPGRPRRSCIAIHFPDTGFATPILGLGLRLVHSCWLRSNAGARSLRSRLWILLRGRSSPVGRRHELRSESLPAQKDPLCLACL